MTKYEKVPILGIFSPKTILMFRVGLKKLGYRNHTYISFKPNIYSNVNADANILMAFSLLLFKLIKIWLYRITSTLLYLSSDRKLRIYKTKNS